MNDNEFMIPVAFIIGLLIGISVGYSITTSYWRRDAISYISPDPASSERTFQWKTNTVIIKP